MSFLSSYSLKSLNSSWLKNTKRFDHWLHNLILFGDTSTRLQCYVLFVLSFLFSPVNHKLLHLFPLNDTCTSRVRSPIWISQILHAGWDLLGLPGQAVFTVKLQMSLVKPTPQQLHIGCHTFYCNGNHPKRVEPALLMEFNLFSLKHRRIMSDLIHAFKNMRRNRMVSSPRRSNLIECCPGRLQRRILSYYDLILSAQTYLQEMSFLSPCSSCSVYSLCLKKSKRFDHLLHNLILLGDASTWLRC